MEDIKDLERFCMEEWSEIPPNVVSNLIKHFRKRLSVVTLSRGGCWSTENRRANHFKPHL
jgi:hypothetical protein